MTELMHILRALVRDELRSLRLGDVGVITSIFPHAEGDTHNYEVNVKLRDAELELRQLPMCTPHIGMSSTPEVGQLVLVTYLGGDPNRAIVVGRLYSDEHNPPPHEEGEWVVRCPAKGGTELRLDKEGSVVAMAGGTKVTLKKDGDLIIEGKADIKVKGEGAIEIKVSGAAKVDCSELTVTASGNINIG